MNKDTALSLLRSHEASLRCLGVEHLYLFGSTARGDAHNGSDVDLFIDYAKGRFGLFDLMDVQQHAAAVLGRKVDLTTRDGLHQSLRPHIEAQAVRVF
jgi:predicted nucleotidyltransferase